MKEIREAWFDRLAADTAIRTFTGYTAADQRIYLSWPPENVELSATKPGYITYELAKPSQIDNSTYVEKAQELDIIIETNVWTNSKDLTDDIAERITHIVKDREWLTINYRALKTDKEAEEDITEEHTGTGQIIMYRKYMRFRLWPVYKR